MRRRFLDIGDGGGVLLQDIICITDADNSTKSKVTRDFLKKNSKSAVMPKKDITKVNSLVMTCSGGKLSIYSSPYSVNLIRKKANEKITDLANEIRKGNRFGRNTD